ncbi:MAG: DUF3857 domain-containing protein [Acidobacteriota bacterium]
MSRTTRAILFVGAAVFAAASLFAQPSPAAGTTTPQMPRAFAGVPGPDAEALLLHDRWTLRDDGAVVHERRQRIRVNSSLAINREHGETRVVWDPDVETFEVLSNTTVLPSGRTVQAPANAVVDELPPQVQRNPLWSSLRRKVIVHTALEPGAVIETAFRVTRKADGAPALAVAEPLALPFPVRERLVEVAARPSSPARVRLTGGPAPAPVCEERDGWRVCRVALTSVPALPSEPGTPPRVAMEPYVLAVAGAAAEIGWAGRELLRRLTAAGPAPDEAIAVARKAADAEPDRERRLLAAMKSLNESLSVSSGMTPSLSGWRLRPLAEVWRAGWASPLELAALHAGVLGALRFDAVPALLLPGPLATADSAGFALHDRVALHVRIPGTEGRGRLYDPQEPAGDEPLELSLGPAHAILPGGDEESLSVPALPWSRRLVVTARVDEKGAVKGEFAIETTGGATPHAPLVQDPQQVANRLAGGLLEGAKAKDARVTRLERHAAGLTASFEGSLPERDAAGLVTVAIAGVPGGVSTELPPLPAAQRATPLALPGPGDEEVEIRLDLPASWRVAALPVPVTVANGAGRVEVRAETAAEDKGVTRVTFVRRLALETSRLSGGDAAQARELLVAWGSPASRGVLLRPPAVAAK